MSYDALQSEFCPPLDTSLLAALVADLDGTSEPQIEALRSTLRELAHQATAHYEHELDLCFLADDSGSCPTESSSDLSSFASPLGFLSTALPHIPQARLRRALSEAGTSQDGDVDMLSVMDTILTCEFVRELEERGLDALSDDEPLRNDAVHPKPKQSHPGKKTKTRGKTVPLVDIRQKHHLLPIAPPAPDPWTQLSSLSEHLAALLPPHPTTFFLSHFHSPNHPSPAKALRTALFSIAGAQNESSSNKATLFTMLDILRDSPMYNSLNPEQRSTLYADAQLALRAACGRGDDAIDIVWLLLELDLDLYSGTLAMGIYHNPQSPLSPTYPSSSSSLSPSTDPSTPSPNRDRSNSSSAATRKLPSGPPPIQPPPTSKRKSVSSSSATSPIATSSHSTFQWQTIPEKPPKGPHPLALHIPAYDSANQSRRSAASKIRGTGNGFGKGGKDDVGELTHPDLKRRMAASLKKRDELLREASKAWTRGNAKTRGGEVALYFAERAREFQELARREALDEARIMVESKRLETVDRRTVDLHGTSISEAVVIIKEILDQEGCSVANPLKIITGRGTHSVNGVAVLKPAVRNALVKDGWNVGVWDGGLVVRGRT